MTYEEALNLTMVVVLIAVFIGWYIYSLWQLFFSSAHSKSFLLSKTFDGSFFIASNLVLILLGLAYLIQQSGVGS